MKKILCSFLTIVLFLTGCTNSNKVENKNTVDNSNKEEVVEKINFSNVNDPKLLTYVEEGLYKNVVEKLDSDKYFVENVQATFVSNEYLEESKYNSQSNIYFGYSLAQLDQVFDDTKYIFDIDEEGNTTVKKLDEISDSFDQVIQNVAVGSGVILICVTVSLVAAPSAPAVSMIFAASAKSASVVATSSAALDGVVATAITGFETKDMNKALKSGLVAASEGFKYGAIFGSISGGVPSGVSLKGATANGLTMNQAAKIQKETKYPLELIKNFHSMEEYEVYKNASLQLAKVNGKNALVQKIDWDFVGNPEDGLTNAQRVLKRGWAPLDPSGKPYDLHHIGQKQDSPLAILTKDQHNSYRKTLHQNTGQSPSKINRNLFDKEKKQFWKDLLEQAQGGIQ